MNNLRYPLLFSVPISLSVSLPLQAHEGDLAVFNAAYEINFNDETYLIVPHSAILMLMRDEGLFE